MVHNCLHVKAPRYLTDYCTPVSDIASRRHLHSASRRHLLVLRRNLSTYGRRAFSVAGPAAWNSVWRTLWTITSCGQFQIVTLDSFVCRAYSALEVSHIMRYINLLTYLLNGTPSHSYSVSLAVWDHTVLPATRHKWTQHTLTPAIRPIFSLPTPEGWKAELTYVTCYIPRWFTRPQTVTHPSIINHWSSVNKYNTDNKLQCESKKYPLRFSGIYHCKGKGRTLVIAPLCRQASPQRHSGTWRAPSSITHTCLIPSQP